MVRDLCGECRRAVGLVGLQPAVNSGAAKAQGRHDRAEALAAFQDTFDGHVAQMLKCHIIQQPHVDFRHAQNCSLRGSVVYTDDQLVKHKNSYEIMFRRGARRLSL